MQSHNLFKNKLDSAGNLTGAEATSTNVNPTGRTVYDCLNALYIGFPNTVRTSVRMGNLNTKGKLFIANFTLSHEYNLLLISYIALNILPHSALFCKCFFTISFKK